MKNNTKKNIYIVKQCEGMAHCTILELAQLLVSLV